MTEANNRDSNDRREPALKLALVRQKYTAFGGAERFTDRAMDALKARGVDISVVAREWRGDSPFEVIQSDPFHIGRRWRDSSFHQAACLAVESGGFDLVQSHERIPCCDIYRAGDGLHRSWLEQRCRLRGGFSKMATKLSPYHRYTLRAEERLFMSHRLKAVICNSQLVKSEIQQAFGLPDERFEVIYTGVDANHFEPGKARVRGAPLRESYGIDDSRPIMLLVGSGYERKGVEQFLRALAKTPEEIIGWVVGNDREPARFEKLAEELGVSQRVLFLGPQKDVVPFYGAADALVLPSLYDPFPNASLEAMACGLPVVVSEKCGTVDIVNEGENGFIRDALDIDGIASAIEQIADPTNRASMSQAARNAVLPYGLTDMAERLMGLYRRLLNR
ncbi:MAG: glycosyltransferase family 4 protein [Gammaproteobacteria bacterium]